MTVLETLFFRKFVGDLLLQPLFISKLNTTVQFLLVLLVILSLVINLHPLIIDGFIWLVTATTLLSGYVYINEW